MASMMPQLEPETCPATCSFFSESLDFVFQVDAIIGHATLDGDEEGPNRLYLVQWEQGRHALHGVGWCDVG